MALYMTGDHFRADKSSGVGLHTTVRLRLCVLPDYSSAMGVTIGGGE